MPLHFANSNDVPCYWYNGDIYLGEMLVQISIQSSGNVFAVKCCGESSLLLLSLYPERKKVRNKKAGGYRL